MLLRFLPKMASEGIAASLADSEETADNHGHGLDISNDEIPAYAQA